ncbi:MAG: F0F1 ATP synthase subunit A [Candidatus Jettenia sp. CY-1]|nr:MAG: F0F1 ATP synthase subunit A [Candidatus Jettenia sp. CY-1]
MEISPDSVTIFTWGYFHINATIVYTWVVMALLIIVSLLVTQHLSAGFALSRWQNFLETIVDSMRNQIREIIRQRPEPYLSFIGTLFLFISISNFLSIVPGYHPPTSSFSTTAALAICVFFAVPFFSITQSGLAGYLKYYIKPSMFMLPFNILGVISHTLTLAIRLFGNIMSGTLIGAILLSVIPFFVPAVMEVLELLIGQIQAYIFAILAAVYIASATRAGRNEE